jgi:hypothetical protein
MCSELYNSFSCLIASRPLQSSQPFRHFVLTRFNIATPGKEARLRNQPDWLDHRFELFERYCLPSVRGQIGNPLEFDWLILFDSETPVEYKRRISSLTEIFPFVPIYVGEVRDLDWWSIIRNIYSDLPPRILTTRLDNDDAIGSDFVTRTQVVAIDNFAAAPIGIVLENGLVRSRTSLYQIRHRRNAFASWLEAASDDSPPHTAAGIPHMEAENFGRILIESGPPAWLQIVHDRNVSNKVRGWRVRNLSFFGNFDSTAFLGLSPVSRSQILLENLIVFPLRKVRDIAAQVLRRYIL